MTLESDTMLGRRVECEGFRGTVCFVGEIAGTGPGLWLGVDWDDVERGKHDGSHKDVRYFTARDTTSGSFVRPHKVNFGRSCSEAILGQYEPLQQDKLDSMQREAVFKANKAQVKVFEYVGFEKVLNKTSKHENLVSMDIPNQCIKDGDERLSELCPNVVELDIRQNLFSSWEDIASVTKYLPHLNVLNISQNRISNKTNDSLLPAFAGVEHLIAGNMNWTCEDLIQAAKLFPSLKSLQIQNNNISTLDSELCNLLPQIQKLDLANNPLASWGEVIKIADMGSLQFLNLKNCSLGEIQFEENSTPFPALQTLNLSENKISNWSSISALENLKQLKEFYFRNNPVLDSENFETNRQIIICRISHLKTLDKIIITETEKRGAALDYLKKYGTMYLKEHNNLQEFNKVHPCYLRLVEKYGAPEESELIVGSAKLKSSLITVSILCPQQSSTDVQKKVPRTMKVQKLRGMLQKLLSTGGRPLTLSYRCQDKPEINYDFDNDLKDLAFYSIQEGDQIIVTY